MSAATSRPRFALRQHDFSSFPLSVFDAISSGKFSVATGRPGRVAARGGIGWPGFPVAAGAPGGAVFIGKIKGREVRPRSVVGFVGLLRAFREVRSFLREVRKFLSLCFVVMFREVRGGHE
jgi:hypothetical protein